MRPLPLSLRRYLCVAQPAWGAVAFIPTIVLERALYVRERNDGLYRPVTYIIFKMIDEASGSGEGGGRLTV